MDELIAFVTARLDEDEATAKAAFRSVLVTEGFHIFAPARPGVPQLPVADAIDAETAAHIARHDPARVLRDVAAGRAHIRAWEAIAVDFTRIDETEREFGAREALEHVIEADAAVWSDHPDYRQEWAP